MGVAAAATAGQTPRVSRMRRLPFDNAVVRSSKLGCDAASCGTASMSADAHAEPLERDGKTRADHAAADDGDVEPSRRVAARHARQHQAFDRPRASSRAPPSAPPERPSVTSTSSSMRTPIFQNSLGTRGEGRM